MINAGHPADLTTWRNAHRVRAADAVVFVCTVVMAGGTPAIPLYVRWASRFGSGPLTTVAVFPAYVAGVVGTLLVAGSLSGTVGRHDARRLRGVHRARVVRGSRPAHRTSRRHT